MQEAGHPAPRGEHQFVPLAEGVEGREQAAAGEVVAVPAVAAHQLEPLRERRRVIARERVVRCEGVARFRVGRVHVETRAQGVTFVTLEDETGSVNLIVWRDVAERQRRALVGARLLGVAGELQIEGEVVHVIAHRLVDLSRWLGGLSAPSRDFH
jgi:error-prone DNA polymerase